MPARRLRCFLLLLLLPLPMLLQAQVLPAGGGAEGGGVLPETLCVNSVGIGITPQGVLVCGPVTPAMTADLAPTGDVSATWQVTATHLAAPLPVVQGGLGLATGPPGGLLYFSGPTTLEATAALPQNAPLVGGGLGPPVAGTRSGTTLEFATILGAHVVGKQLVFDANGNVIASAFDAGATATVGETGVPSVFGRTGAVVAQAGDYTAAQVIGAAQLTAANVFTHAGGQSMPQLLLAGPGPGALTLRAAAGAASALLVLPMGSTDFSGTGGDGQVVRQNTTGGPLTVSPLAFSNLDGVATAAQVPPLEALTGTLTAGQVPPLQDLTGVATAAQVPPLQNLSGLLPVVKGGLGLASGPPGGMLYFSGATALGVTAALPQNAPVLGGGVGPPTTGTRSGTTLELATILGAHVVGKQLVFDANGNVIASAFDAGPTVPTGDVSPTWQVTATHLSAPLPVPQGGLGLGSGTPGALLYFSSATTLGVTPLLPLWAPILGGGPGASPVPGTRVGSTLAFATVQGSPVAGKQLMFDSAGDIVVSGYDAGQSGVTSVFGRTGAVVAQAGDYTAAQVTGAAQLTAANVFGHPGGQSMTQALLTGSTSGALTLRAPASAGAALLVLPAGSTDFSATGGPGQVVRQTTLGGPFTVSPLAFSEVSGSVTATQVPPLQSLLGVATAAQVPPLQSLLGVATAAQVPALPDLSGVLSLSKGGLGHTDTTFSGTSHTLATVAGALPAGMGVTVDAQGNLITTGLPPGGGGSGSGTVSSGGPGTLAQYAVLGTTVSDSGVIAGQVVTAVSAFTVGRVLQAAGNNRTVSETSILTSTLCTTTAVCTGYQANLGFTAENSANKNASTALGTSNTEYPTVGAVKGYADTLAATKQNTVTWGTGLAFAGVTASVASTEAGFLTNGGATPLVGGPSNQGRMQVLASGELQYTDGATTSVVHSGLLTQSGLKWNVIPSVCTTDANLGKLTITASGEIQCAADIGGTGGAGGVTSVFSRTGSVIAQPGDYSASQVTNAADVTAANVFTHASGQSMAQLVLLGSSSGTLTIRAPAAAGSASITWPGGVTNFTTTGGPGQVLRQSALGGAFTVGQLSASDLSNGVVGSGAILLATNTAITQLVNLSTNGLVRTSGSNGTLGVDTAVYLTANQTITLSGDATGTGTTSIPVTVTRLNGGVFSGVSGNLVAFGASNTPADSGITGANLVTAPSVFTSGQVLQAAGNNRTASNSGILVSALCTTASVCSGYQPSLGFTPVASTRTLTFAGTSNQVTVSLTGAQDLSANRDWTFSLPQNIDTGAFVRYGGLGLNVAAPINGLLAQTASANSVVMHTLRRATDSAPSGAFTDYQSASGVSLWQVDITGTLAIGTVPWARVSAPDAAADGVTKGVAAFAAADFNAAGGVISLDYANAQAASSTTKGFLTAADWTAFNAKVAPGRALTILGTANQITVTPGAQDLSIDRTWTLSLPSNLTLAGTTTGTFSGSLVGNASTATTFAVDPTPCGANLFVTDIAASGALTCAQPAFSGLTGTATAGQIPTAPNLAAFNDFTNLSGQKMVQLLLPGSTSGSLTLRAAAVAGTASVLTWPAGVTDFSATGGLGQVVKQLTTGGAFTVGPLSSADVGLGNVDNTSDATKNTVSATLENKFVVPRAFTCTPIGGVITPNADTMDICEYYSLTTPATIANPTHTGLNPRPHQRLEVALKSATPQALTFGADFDETCGQPKPTSTTGGGAIDHFLFVFSPSTSKFCMIATSQPPPTVLGITGSTGYVMLPMGAVILPTTNMAVIDVSENNIRLLFDASTNECAWWNFKMPPDYTSNPVMKFPYSMLSATSGAVVFQFYLQSMPLPYAADANTDSYGTVNSCTDTVPATAGFAKEVSCVLTNTDGLAARALVRLKVCRDASNVADTAPGDLEGLGAAMLEYTR